MKNHSSWSIIFMGFIRVLIIVVSIWCWESAFCFDCALISACCGSSSIKTYSIRSTISIVVIAHPSCKLYLLGTRLTYRPKCTRKENNCVYTIFYCSSIFCCSVARSFIVFVVDNCIEFHLVCGAPIAKMQWNTVETGCFQTLLADANGSCDNRWRLGYTIYWIWWHICFIYTYRVAVYQRLHICI